MIVFLKTRSLPADSICGMLSENNGMEEKATMANKTCGSCFRCREGRNEAKRHGLPSRKRVKWVHFMYAPRPRRRLAVEGGGLGCPKPLTRKDQACEHHKRRWIWNIEIIWKHIISKKARRLYEYCIRAPLGGLREPVPLKWVPSLSPNAAELIPNGEPKCPHCGDYPYSLERCVFCGQRFTKVERRCRVCGCTDECGCPEGCWWIEDDLCSSCGDKSGISEKAQQDIDELLADDKGVTAPKSEADSLAEHLDMMQIDCAGMPEPQEDRQ